MVTTINPTISDFSPNVTKTSNGGHGASEQNWAIVQDSRGVMYFGNHDAILEYDGVSWRKIYVKNRTTVRSFAIDGNGSDAGYLKSLEPVKPIEELVRIYFPGAQVHDEISMALAYSAADIFVAPSIQDNLPNTIIESLACGTPCAAFDIGDQE